jgi:Nucleotidyl transferase AbiEii toxin, Type IV TA system
MKSLFRLAAELDDALAHRNWRYCFIGGIALQRWGQPRLTNDIDVTVLSDTGMEAAYIDELLKLYKARLPDARKFALEHRVLLLASNDGIPIDVALGGIAFEERAVSRASRYEFLPGLSLLTCSAEDLVVFKSFADRPRDWVDVETILVRQEGRLDWPYILEQLRLLSEISEAPEIVNHLMRLRDGK